MTRFVLFYIMLTGFFCNAQLTDALKIRINGPMYYDETVIRFLPSATNDFDGNYDAHKLFSPNQSVPAIYTADSSGNLYSINAINTNSLVDTSISVFTKTPSSGNYTIDFIELGDFDNNIKITIDLLNGLSFIMNSDTSINIYLASNTTIPSLNPSVEVSFKNADLASSVYTSKKDINCYMPGMGALYFGSSIDSVELKVRDTDGIIMYSTNTLSQNDSLLIYDPGTYYVEFQNNQDLITDTLVVDWNMPTTHIINPYEGDTIELGNNLNLVIDDHDSIDYYWHINQSPIGSGSTLVHQTTDTGWINIDLSAEINYCNDIKQDSVFVTEPSILNSAGDVNPNSSITTSYTSINGLHINIGASSIGKLSLEIYNSIGQMIKKVSISSSDYNLFLNEPVIFIRLYSKDYYYAKKLLLHG